MASPDHLTRFQRAAIEAFFSLPESRGYVLAGGAGLVAAGLSTRPTDDVDLFGADLEAGVTPAADAFEALCLERSWPLHRLREAPTFRRVEVTDQVDTVLVDFAIDMPPIRAVNLTAVGPTFEPTELGARKLLALFDRAAARDFADLCTLGARFDVSDLLALARDLDGGFDTAIFVEMLESVRRFSDEELAATGSDPARVRQFAADLADRLR